MQINFRESLVNLAGQEIRDRLLEFLSYLKETDNPDLVKKTLASLSSIEFSIHGFRSLLSSSLKEFTPQIFTNIIKSAIVHGISAKDFWGSPMGYGLVCSAMDQSSNKFRYYHYFARRKNLWELLLGGISKKIGTTPT